MYSGSRGLGYPNKYLDERPSNPSLQHRVMYYFRNSCNGICNIWLILHRYWRLFYKKNCLPRSWSLKSNWSHRLMRRASSQIVNERLTRTTYVVYWKFPWQNLNERHLIPINRAIVPSFNVTTSVHPLSVYPRESSECRVYVNEALAARNSKTYS